MSFSPTLNSTERPNTFTDDGVVAELKFAGPDSPPAVILSFQGTEEPVELWAELTRMGWNVPHCPPRPASAIVWEPDPITGTNYTIRPWWVKEFEIRDGRWPSSPPVDLTTQTYDLLRQHGRGQSGAHSRSAGPNPQTGHDLIRGEDGFALDVEVDGGVGQLDTELRSRGDGLRCVHGRHRRAEAEIERIG